MTMCQVNLGRPNLLPENCRFEKKSSYHLNLQEFLIDTILNWFPKISSGQELGGIISIK